MKLFLCSLFVLLAGSLAAAAQEVKSPGSGAVVNAPAFAAASALTTESAGSFTTLADGTNVLVLRFLNAGSPAMKLRIGDLRLPTGAKLYAFGLNGGAVTQVAGPWTGSGPAAGEDFETPALAGSEVVLEVQVAGDNVPSDVPFRVIDMVAADRADEIVEATDAAGVRTSLFRGMELTHEVRDGQAIFEGDILLAEEELRPLGTSSKGKSRASLGITGARYRWPNGVIPYRVDPAVPNQARITNAVNHWNTVMAGVVRLVPHNGEIAHIFFARPSNTGQCASNVGMLGYMQYVWIGDLCSTGNMIHEIGHAVGLWHEQSREDRDQFVKIFWENIPSAQQFNFAQNINNGDDLGAYDFGSIMHYNATAFSSNGKPTIQTIPAGIPIGQRSGLSAGDIAGVKALYSSADVPPPPPPPVVADVAVTIGTNPAGLPVIIDGAQFNGTVTLMWRPGTTHTISAPTPPVANGTRRTFVNWTDGGAQTHIITVPSAATGYKANFSVAYAVNVATSGGGSLSVSPMAADSFYAPDSTLTLTASPGWGNCFAGWQGLLTGTPASTSLQVTQPYSLTATFQPGSFSLNKTNMYIPAAGTSVQLGFQATSGCVWKALSSAPWLRIVSQSSGTGPGVLSVTADPNPTSTARIAVVSIGGKSAVISQAGKI